MIDTNQLIKDFAKELERVDNMKKKARQHGKKSKVKYNFNKIGKKI